MAEKARCEICNRSFKNQEALDMHNHAKHETGSMSGSKSNSFTIPKKKLIVSLIVLGVIGLIIWSFSSGFGATGQAIVVSEDDPFLGDENAPVTIVEFGDYQCPICQRFWANTLPQIKSQYIDTGKVKYVFRDFPLTSIHPMAMASAEAANCVFEQGGNKAYFEYHNKLYANQYVLSVNNLKIWANEIGYNIDNCLDSGKFRKEIRDDLSSGQSSGVRGTPSFFVNGKPLSGAQPFPVFQQLIEAEL